jgi:hypothetical protein
MTDGTESQWVQTRSADVLVAWGVCAMTLAGLAVISLLHAFR